jgi:hypothetical protein
MIKAFAGGWDAMAAALGMTRDALENRIYERKGQTLHVDTPLQMQAFSGTTFYAEAIATLSGGVFTKLIDAGDIHDEDLEMKFHELYGELGLLSRTYSESIKNGEIDKRERARLSGIADEIHKTMQELMSLMFAVYCRSESKEK